MSKTNLVASKNSSKINIIIIGISIITLYFNTQSLDPFNPPKLWALMLFTSVLLGDILVKRKQIKLNFHSEISMYALLVFISSMLISALVSDQKYIAFFGDTQRKNGFIQYLCMAVVFLSVAQNIKNFHYKKFYFLISFLGTILSVYGYAQHLGNDFVSWNNPYNSVILTVGNPNFAAAIMSILLVANLVASFDKSSTYLQRIFNCLVSGALLFVILFSDARQGILSALVGATFVFLIFAFNKNRKLGLILGLMLLTLGIMSILGMLQKGPLAQFLYKDSISVRGYYWRAAISMLRDNPVFGVGIDSFGLYFKEYREAQYPLRYGFSLTSTNAHNTFLQFFSTGGIIMGFSYLIFVILILYKALRFVVYSNKSTKNITFYLSILGAWIAFQAQSLISIDNIGISIWHWTLAGMLFGLSKLVMEDDSINAAKKLSNSAQPISTLLSWVLFIPVFVIVSLLYRGENESIKLRDGINTEGMSSEEFVKNKSSQINSLLLIDPYYKFLTVNPLNNSGYKDQALAVLLESHNANPRNADYLESLARFFEGRKNFERAIYYRNIIKEIDPWNAENLLVLGLNYKSNNQIQDMNKCLEEILKFASKNPIALRAQNELKV